MITWADGIIRPYGLRSKAPKPSKPKHVQRIQKEAKLPDKVDDVLPQNEFNLAIGRAAAP